MAQNKNKNSILSYRKRKFKRVILKNQFLRIISLILIVLSLLIGDYFCLSDYYVNRTYDSDFGGSYTALVAVVDINKDSRPDNQPNGDAVQAAKSLESRLNPLGVNDITVEIEGSNYLRVTAPKSSYSSSVLFQNAIERSGSVYIISTDGDTKYNDILVNNTKKDDKKVNDDKDDIGFTRDAMSSYISGATTTTINSSTGRMPVIEYLLNGTALVDYLKKNNAAPAPNPGPSQLSKINQNSVDKTEAISSVNGPTPGGGGDSGGGDKDVSVASAILVDPDSLYNLVRNYFLSASSKISLYDRLNQYYDNIIKPLRNIYDPSNTKTSQLTRDVLYSMFYCSYKLKGDSNNKVNYGSLISSDISELYSAGDFYNKIDVDSFKFLDNTQNYVYDANATTNDFKESNDGKSGKYSKVNLFDSPGNKNKKNENKFDNSKNIFSAINPAICDLVLKLQGTGDKLIDSKVLNQMEDFFIFNGTLNTSAQQNFGVNQSFVLNGKYLVTFTKSYSIAKLGASLFNASSSGFQYTVSAVSELSNTIPKKIFYLFLIISSLIVLALLSYLVLVYRVIGVIIGILIASVAMFILGVNYWFSITAGTITIISLITIIGINTELYARFMENIKENIFNKKRNPNASFNISVKEFIPVVIDSFIAITIPLICMLWISTSTAKMLTISIVIGLLISSVMFLIISLIIFKIIFKTTWFENNSALFIADKKIFRDSLLPYYKIKEYEEEIHYLRNKNEIDSEKYQKQIEDKIFAINEKITFYKDSDDSKLTSKIESLQNQINSIREEEKNELDKIKSTKHDFSDKIELLKNKIEKIKLKQEEFEKSSSANNVLSEYKIIKKLENRILMLENRIKFYSPTLQKRSYNRIVFKIEKTNALLNARKDIQSENVELAKIMTTDARKKVDEIYREYKENEDLSNNISISTNDNLKSKTVSSFIKNGRNIFVIITVAFIILSTCIGLLIGPNLDSSLSNRTNYTIWGDNISTIYDRMSEIKDEDLVDSSAPGLKTDIQNYINEYNDKTNKGQSSDAGLIQAKVISEFLKDIFGIKNYLSFFMDQTNAGSIGDLNLIRNTSSTYGDNFILNDQSKNITDNQPWVTLSVTFARISQSFFVKEIFLQKLGINFTESNVSPSSGSISKSVSPSSNFVILKQILYALLISSVILFFYFILRFNWTYFIAMLFSIILIALLCSIISICLYLPMGISTIYGGVFVLSNAILWMVLLFSQAKKNMISINQDSVNKYFEEEINLVYDNKQKTKSISDKLFLKRTENKILIHKLKGKNLYGIEKKQFEDSLDENKKAEIKKEIANIKAEYIKYKKSEIENLNQIKKDNKKKLIEHKQKNIFNKIISLKLFNFSFRRLIGSAVYIIPVAIALLLCQPYMLSMAFILLVGFVATSVVMIFITSPMVIALESWRLRRKVANKKHINNLVIRNEEQIVVGLND